MWLHNNHVWFLTNHNQAVTTSTLSCNHTTKHHTACIHECVVLKYEGISYHSGPHYYNPTVRQHLASCSVPTTTVFHFNYFFQSSNVSKVLKWIRHNVVLQKNVNNSAITLHLRNKPAGGSRSCPQWVVLHYFQYFNTSDNGKFHKLKSLNKMNVQHH